MSAARGGVFYVTLTCATLLISGFPVSADSLADTMSSLSPQTTGTSLPWVVSHVVTAGAGTKFTAPPLSTQANDTLVVFAALRSGAKLSAVSDSTADSFVPIAYHARTDGTSHEGLAVWAAYAVHGGSAVTVSATALSTVRTVLMVVDVSGVAAPPLSALSPFSEGVSASVSTTIAAGAGNLVLMAVAVEGTSNVFAAGGDTRIDSLSYAGQPYDSGGDLQQGVVADGPLTMSAVLGTSAPWIATSLALVGFSSGGNDIPVTFSESGLPGGTSWSVTLDGSTVAAVAPSSIVIPAHTGSRLFQVTEVPGFDASPASGTVEVAETPITVPVAFHPSSDDTVPYIQHVVLIELENMELSQVLSGAPYQRYLSATYGFSTQFYAACHGSLPNYMAFTSGRSLGCSIGKASPVTNLADLFDQAGLSWMGYFESMPAPCTRQDIGEYTVDHNPFVHYANVVKNTSRCNAHVVNSAAFNASLASGTLPRFSFYVPNNDNDCHNTNLAFCDAWLRSFLSPILNSTNPKVESVVAHTAFMVFYDEGTSKLGYSVPGYVNSWCVNATGQNLATCGGHSYLVVVSPYSDGSYSAPTSPYNIESTIEWLFALPSDGGWDGTPGFPSMSSLFSFETNGYGDSPVPGPG